MTAPPDPRSQVQQTELGYVVCGWRCTNCGRTVALPAVYCARCRGILEVATFGPNGTVWSATVLRVALPDQPPPTHFAYVDLDSGPRVLGHVRQDSADRLTAGRQVRLMGKTDRGDLLFQPDVP